jgi:hypothetical protein
MQFVRDLTPIFVSIRAIRGQKQQATIVPFIVIPHKPIHRQVKIYEIIKNKDFCALPIS